MDAMPERYIERLLEVTSKKYSLLKEMFLLTKRQSEVITDEGIEKLEEYVAEKQVIIDKIDKCDEEFNVYFQRFKQVLGVNDLEAAQLKGLSGIKELKDITGNIIKVIREISVLENENSEKVKALLNNIGGEIKSLNQGKKVNLAYNPMPVQPASYYFDKKK